MSSDGQNKNDANPADEVVGAKAEIENRLFYQAMVDRHGSWTAYLQSVREKKSEGKRALKSDLENGRNG